MDKRTAKRKVAKTVADQLRTNRAHVYEHNDGSGNPLSEADQQRLRNAYNELIAFLEERANGSPTARW